MSDQDPTAPEGQAPDTPQGQDASVAPELEAQPEGGGHQPEHQEPARPFSPEQEQFLGSWMGRKIKEHVEKGLQPIMERLQSPQGGPPYGVHPSAHGAPQNDAIKQLNESLRDRLLDGDVIGVFQDISRTIETARTNVTKQNSDLMVRAMTGYAEDPEYKDIYPDAERIAREELAKGTPPAYAAELGYTRAKLRRVEGARQKRDGSPALMPAGRVAPKAKVVTLPAALKAAYERDKKDGFFKNEAEYIANLGPEVKAKYGL